ncbi:hypothetical protein [endosymbiont of unidentified scaly snail isolate Monju]|uniref:hypothetical protein n=1 Tax=endosymbiont of unidentified scaly snail isolate Monju TaxID=1248727 RepID=UPI0011DCDC97|nr:hypothetical protein [endosymbiont of unidentified scaly snail isolate Monju]
MPEINNVWRKIPEERRRLFDSLSGKTNKESWPIWEAMSAEEKNCYRFTRAGLEILEQAYIANGRGWIDSSEIWKKWEGWMISWKKTNSYVPYVVSEMEHWFTESFLRFFDKLE